MSTEVDADRVWVSKSGTPVANRNDGVGVIVDAGGDATTGDGLVALSNGSVAQCLDPSMLCEAFEDFIGSTIIPIQGSNDAAQGCWMRKSAGTLTTAGLVSGDADNGKLAITMAATNEAEQTAIYFGDEQGIDSDQEPVIVFRVSINAAFVSTNTYFVGGFASAYNAVADDIAQNAWIRIQTADLSVLLESDNTSVDNDDKDTGVDLVVGTEYEFMVSCSSVHGASVTNVKFFYRATLGGDWIALNGPGTALPTTTFAMSADTAIQPYVCFGKLSSTDTGGCLIDYIHCWWKRN